MIHRIFDIHMINEEPTFDYFIVSGHLSMTMISVNDVTLTCCPALILRSSSTDNVIRKCSYFMECNFCMIVF